MSRKMLPLAVLGGFVLGGCAATAPQTLSRPSEAYHSSEYRVRSAGYATGPVAERVDPLQHAIREVDESPDVDAALDAYNFGLRINRDSVKLRKAYVRRMVELDVPHLAAGAAAKVVLAEPDAPLSLAVLAYTAGHEGNMVDALTDITVAARRGPAEAFVQRTSGHLLAWYDNNPRPPGLPSTVRYALQAMHESLDDNAVFADAYNDAADYYQERQAAIARGPTTGPTTNPANEPGIARGARPETLPPDEGPSYAGGGGGGGPIAPSPIYEPYGPVYEPYYPEPYAFSPWYYGWGPGFLFGAGYFVNFANFHHHHHDFYRGHDHGQVAGHDHNGTGGRDHGGTPGRGGIVGATGGRGAGVISGGGRHVATVGRTGVYLPPATGPRGVGSAAGKWVGRPTASVTGGFENLNTSVHGSGVVGAPPTRSTGFRARGPAPTGGLRGSPGMQFDGSFIQGGSRGVTGLTAPVPAPTGNVGIVPAPTPIVVPSAPTGGSGARGTGGGTRAAGGGGAGRSSGNSGRR